MLVAALLGLRAAGATLGWGFQFQSPVFLALMAGLLFFLGLSLAGQFEIGLTLTSAGGSLAAKQGYTGSFFTGVLAVVVATPCTAPFMGAAVGYALAQPAGVTFAVFTALALGLAAPYVALTLQPAWTRLLPRPGAWMEVLRQAISVPIFVTVIWLAWVLAQAYGAGLLAALLASFLLLAIAGWFLGRWPAKRWATVVAALILLGVVAFSVWAPGEVGCCAGDLDRVGDSRRLAAVSRRCSGSLPGAGAAGVCGLHREVVPELPGQRACGAEPARGAEGLCRRQRGLAAGRLDAARRGDCTGAGRAGPQRRARICAVHAGPEQPADAARGADAGHCDGRAGETAKNGQLRFTVSHP